MADLTVTPDTNKKWSNFVLWFLVIITIGLESLNQLGVNTNFRDIGKNREKQAIMYFWTPTDTVVTEKSDTIVFTQAFNRLHDLLIDKAGGWTRTSVNGGWMDSKMNKLHEEAGYIYFVSFSQISKTKFTEFKRLLNEILTSKQDGQISTPIDRPSFGQIESYIEVLNME